MDHPSQPRPCVPRPARSDRATVIRTLSFFSGIGGLDLGAARALERLGFDHQPLAMVEREAFAVAALVEAMERDALAPCPVWAGDMREFPVAEFRGAVDLVVGGFPCQDLSVAGKQRGLQGSRSGLWYDLLEAVCEVGARYLFVENVPGIFSASAKAKDCEDGDPLRALGAVLGSLAERGFDAEWTSLRASDVGAPHRRDRFFLLAHRREYGLEGRVEAGAAPGAARGSGEVLADAGRPGLDQHEEQDLGPERGLEAPCRLDAGRCDGAVGDAPCELHHGTGSGGAGRGTEPPDSGNTVLAHPQGRACGRLPEPRSHGQALWVADGCRDLYGWPPGSDDLDAWADVLRTRPDLAPATEPGLRRVAHGLPGGLDLVVERVRLGQLDRVDRLRALGNAVVPAQAEEAFLQLWSRVHCGAAHLPAWARNTIKEPPA